MSRFGLEIRAANAGDAPGLGELMTACGRSSLAAAVLGERLEAMRAGPGVVLLALEWGPPSGVIALHWYDRFDAAAPTAQITTLLVAPDARRRGIGRALLKAASQAARQAGCGALQLLAPQDDALEGFSRVTGFVQDQTTWLRPLRKKG